jgi:hypothetical protein
MTAEDDLEQQRVWDVLYVRLQEVLRALGEEGYTGDADHWIISDNWGSRQHLVYIFNLEMVSPPIVARMQDCLKDHPDWLRSSGLRLLIGEADVRISATLCRRYNIRSGSDRTL